MHFYQSIRRSFDTLIKQAFLGGSRPFNIVGHDMCRQGWGEKES